MKKATFHLCSNEDGKIGAVVAKGYSEGDIGIHKGVGGWWATHIPTGCLYQGRCLDAFKTKKAALENTLQVISERPDFAQLVQKRLESAEHAAFLEAKKRQT